MKTKVGMLTDVCRHPAPEPYILLQSGSNAFYSPVLQ